MSRVNKIKTYMMHYVVPVPFNLLFVPFDLAWIVWNYAYTCVYNNFFAPIFEDDDDASLHSSSSRSSPAVLASSRSPTPDAASADSPVALAVASASPDASPLHHPSALRKETVSFAAVNNATTSSPSPLHRPAPLRKSAPRSMSPVGIRARIAQAPPSPPASPPPGLTRSGSPKTPKSPGSRSGSPRRRITLKQQAGRRPLTCALTSSHSSTCHVCTFSHARMYAHIYSRAGGD